MPMRLRRKHFRQRNDGICAQINEIAGAGDDFLHTARIARYGQHNEPPRSRDLLLKAIGRCRAILPEIDLTFRNPPVRYDSDREVVRFIGESLGSPLECAVSRAALEDHFGASNVSPKGRIEAFQSNRAEIEELLRTKYLQWPVDEPESLILTTADVAQLRASIEADERVPSQ